LLIEKGATYVSINRYGLTSKEYSAIKTIGGDIQMIENKLFRENISTIKITDEALKGEKGTKLAVELLKLLRQEQKLGEKKNDYIERIQKQALAVLRLEEAFT
jgi:hypothetical protein